MTKRWIIPCLRFQVGYGHFAILHALMSNAGMFPKPHFIESNGIRMAVFEQGEGPAVIMVHGFPELAYSWRHQIPALASAGFRAIAPRHAGVTAKRTRQRALNAMSRPNSYAICWACWMR
jgi:hypothetical protein